MMIMMTTTTMLILLCRRPTHERGALDIFKYNMILMRRRTTITTMMKRVRTMTKTMTIMMAIMMTTTL